MNRDHAIQYDRVTKQTALQLLAASSKRRAKKAHT